MVARQCLAILCGFFRRGFARMVVMEVKKCLICEKEFKIYPSSIKKNTKCCSNKCRGIWISRNTTNKGKNSSFWQGGEIKRICQICGKKFYAKPSNVKRGKDKFCSRKCYGIWRSKNICGENHPRWKGGINSILQQIRHSEKYLKWRSDVFIRDNFICQKCNNRSSQGHSVILESHHKIPFYKLIEEVKNYLPLLNLYDGAMAYIPLWDISNGVTLCRKCHYKTRKKLKWKKIKKL